MAKAKSRTKKTAAKAKAHKYKWDVCCCPKHVLISLLIGLGLCLLATKLLWDWIVPDLFPTGILAPTISWYTAFKVALVSVGLMVLKKWQKYKMIMHWKK